MAKIALLIGISEYGEGLSSLPGTQEDISTLQRVLQNPHIGGFNQIESLPNPDRTQMESTIETLFTENRDRDDLVLLYFSGHGVRDDNGSLYLSSRNTATNAQGRIRTATAVPATALQGYMSRSRSRRQVLILDCCFSGAFANDMKAKQADEAIDVKTQLGGEGRAVLTSSTATQVSYEKDGTSLYTRYLVQGLETGAADRDEDGEITVDELHEYAREQVQEAAPTMQPEIYAVREGYKIVLARASQGDPRLIYRKELEQRAKQKRGRLSPVDRRALNYRCNELGLFAEEAEQIALQVLQPYQEFWAKLEEFEQAIKQLLRDESQLSATSIDDLRYFQRVLKLRDEDVLPILTKYNLSLVSPSLPPSSPPPKPSEPPTPSTNLERSPSASRRQFFNWLLWGGVGVAGVWGIGLLSQPYNPKSSEESPSPQSSPNPPPTVSYSRLENLLQTQQWKAADQETLKLMLKIAGREKEGWLDSESINRFPCDVLKEIDQLWVKYSEGRFGFSVQVKILQEMGSPTQYNAQWEKFGDRVGWRDKNRWLSYSDLNPSLSSPKGIFPRNFKATQEVGGIYLFFSRATTCRV